MSRVTAHESPMQVYRILQSGGWHTEQDLVVHKRSSPLFPCSLGSIPIGLQPAHGVRDACMRHQEVYIDTLPQRVIAIQRLRQCHAFERHHRDACRRQLTQRVLAELVGRSEDWLSKVERNERDIRRLDVLTEVARALRVSVGELLGQPVLVGISGRRRTMFRPSGMR